MRRCLGVPGGKQVEYMTESVHQVPQVSGTEFQITPKLKGLVMVSSRYGPAVSASSIHPVVCMISFLESHRSSRGHLQVQKQTMSQDTEMVGQTGPHAVLNRLRLCLAIQCQQRRSTHHL